MLASTRPKTANTLTDTALDYADRGWPIFPLKPGSKYPATPKHSADKCDRTDPKCRYGHAGWEQRATCDHVPIRNAWQRHNYGVAIACGPANLLVVDIDIAKGGNASGATSLGLLEARHGAFLPETFTVVTPSGGYHLYYHQPDGLRLGNSAGTIGEGIDTRGHGGYVAAPPTRLANLKHPYQLLKDLPVQVLPQWFSELLTTPERKTAEPLPKNSRPSPSKNQRGSRLARYVETAITRQLDDLANAPVGQRNNAVFMTSFVLGQLVGAGVANETHIVERIKTAASIHVGTKCTSSEIERTIASGMRKGINEPRTLPNHLTQ